MKIEIRDGKVFGSGSLDEETSLDANFKAPGSDYVFDLKDGKSVNSVGIRIWVNWIQKVAGQGYIRFQNVPHSFVLQMNMIEGFLPINAKVESFFIPTYNEDTDEEKDELLIVGKDVSLDGGEPTIKKQLATDWEYDIIGSDYFKFLKR